jgi:hypothetical protein
VSSLLLFGGLDFDQSAGDIDFDTQCGVTLEDGIDCRRSLTCGRHSMAAKSAVPGRSAPFDSLLALYTSTGGATAKDILQDISPSAPVRDTKETFSLSDEFSFMFRECSSSDVLHLLRDNWHHYSRWIDGGHMKWQSIEFIESSTQLKKSIAACLVQSARGPLPLQETVMPTIDPQLDEGRLIPAVYINQPSHPEWLMLSYFGVIMKGDVHYYLRCLIAISDEHCPDIDSVTYIYEQIQARYKDNEEIVRYVSRIG